jgi:hypothetical protein
MTCQWTKCHLATIPWSCFNLQYALTPDNNSLSNILTQTHKDKDIHPQQMRCQIQWPSHARAHWLISVDDKMNIKVIKSSRVLCFPCTRLWIRILDDFASQRWKNESMRQKCVFWRRMMKISWTSHTSNEEVVTRSGYRRNKLLQSIQMGQMKCFLPHHEKRESRECDCN